MEDQKICVTVLQMKFEVGQHIHLVGIGGSGMSAIARVLVEQGYRVSGSDRGSSELTEALARDGATVYKGHDAAYIAGADMLIITSAVKEDHVEVAAARAAGIPVYKRQDVMAALMEGYVVVAVAGTKGKTTTASMIVHILRECGQDPSYIVGGVLGNTGTNAGVGTGRQGRRPIFVVEADEYDNMFLGLKPTFIVLTNVDYDHPDFFKTPEQMVKSFQDFIKLLDDPDGGGMLLACAEDPVARKIAEERHAPTYGFSEDAILRAFDIHTDDDGYTAFQIAFKGASEGVPARIALPGSHNVLNALAALYIAPPLVDAPMFYAGIPALESFKPTARRFDLRADVGGVAVVDDYAHNPMSIRATLDAARQRYPERELWAVWQPHTYSRTQALFDDFVTSFKDANHVLITDIYAARENPIEGVSSAEVVAAMSHADVRHTATFADAVKVLRDEVKAPAIILIMSAGDAPQIGVEYLKALQGEGGS